ncbi:Glycosyl hydrolases family 38 C-terminal domain-containing protein [Clostridium sp. USBA 49]|uniref:glycoside hydrolase family 38 N-terminal domain-containing protein n=1 Tax=Clostridium sp. USBA 49 TaxID=1881060 RepID=UPI000999784E|nr:glycosyl hydrolase-related protein [Clostridium sp. USBA 49]SKA85423.1 Glycosyl hydrolases family 38 C-terminal domain-containing protein [Clostridium sp. USBA 49]
MSKVLWAIGVPEGDLHYFANNFRNPNSVKDVVWNVDEKKNTLDEEEKWPLFHANEADPDAGYRLHPYVINFSLGEEPAQNYELRIDFLMISPRLPYLEVNVNGVVGNAYLLPHPSNSNKIKISAGLHTSIYSEGSVKIVIPSEYLKKGKNTIILTSRDKGEVLKTDNIEKIKRLDRMANPAGFNYQYLAFSKIQEEINSTLNSAVVVPTVIYKKNINGELVEKCSFYLQFNKKVNGGNLTLTLKEGNREEKADFEISETALGHYKLDFDVFDGEGKVEYLLTGQINGEAIEERGKFKRKKKWKVYLTPHTHTDIGYTHRQWEVAERLNRNIDKALEIINKDREEGIENKFAYNLDCSWVIENFLKTRSEKKRQELLREIKEKNISVPSNYVDLLTQFASLEDLIRNGELSEEVLREVGKSPDYMSVVDVASITGSAPAILEGMGVKYLIHANNQDRGPFRLNGGLHKISPFYWEGTNGGKILVWLSKMYCELRKVCGSPPVLYSASTGLNMWLDEYEREDYVPDAVLLYGMEADNTDIDPQPHEFVKEWNRTYEYPQLINSDGSEFFKYVEGNFKDFLKTVKGDSGAYWEDGCGSTATASRQVRDAQAILTAAERLESLAVIHNENWSYPLEDFKNAWREVLLFDEHTWGSHLAGIEEETWLQQDSWEVKEHMAKNSLMWAKRLLLSAATRHSLSWNNKGREVVLYNPHSWEASGAVRVEIAKNEKVYDSETGEEIPIRKIVELKTQATVELWVEKLPGLSYRRYILKPAKVEQKESKNYVLDNNKITIENQYYKLVFDIEKGCIESLIDKATNNQLVDLKDQYGLGKFIYAKGGEGTKLTGNHYELSDEAPELIEDFNLNSYEIEEFAHGTSIKIKGEVVKGELQIECILNNKTKKIDLNYVYTKEENLNKEAVYVAFPFNLSQPEVLSDSQLGWVNWAKDELPGACKEWLPLQTGIMIKGKEGEIHITSPDIPLFTVNEVVLGRWPKELNLSGSRIFSYVLNNYWNTNYKGCQGGTFIFRYSITSDKEIALEKAYKLGWESRQPIYVQRMSYQDFRETKAPYTNEIGTTLAQIGSDKVVVSTIKKANYEEGFIIRLQEISGRKEIAEIRFTGKKIKKAYKTDLLERNIEEISVESDGRLKVEVEPWSLSSIRIIL